MRAVGSMTNLMATPPLACAVRGCGLALVRGGRAWTCARGHSYDVARSGYVNLLQPQDRKSPGAGDTREAVDARARLLEAGIGGTILEGFADRAATLLADADATVVDLGSGSGDALHAIAARRRIAGIGIDLSTAAADRAARRFPEFSWIVANADRRLPLLDQTVALVVSLHARRNPDECARVLKPTGSLLVAIPAADDLIELREAALGARVERERADAVVQEHVRAFTLTDRISVRERHRLEPDALRDLLSGTYRGARTRPKTATLAAMDVTLAADFLIFARSPTV